LISYEALASYEINETPSTTVYMDLNYLRILWIIELYLNNIF